MPSTWLKTPLKIRSFVKCFVVNEFVTLFILKEIYGCHFQMLILKPVCEILLSFKFYLVSFTRMERS